MESEEGEHVVRLLNCVDDYLLITREVPWRGQVPRPLTQLLAYNKDPAVQEKARGMLKRFS